MIDLHDSVLAMADAISSLTERGQISIPASIRRAMGLEPGQELSWRKLSEDEVRVQVLRRKKSRNPTSVIGAGKKIHQARGWPTRTDAWLKLLREGEEA